MNNNSPNKFQWMGDLFSGGGGETGSQFMWGGGGGETAPATAPIPPTVAAPPPTTVGPAPETAPAQVADTSGGGILSTIGDKMGTVVGAGLSIAGSVIGARKARRQMRKARKNARRAKKEMKEQLDIYKNLDISNPYLNMENTMEDLTIDQKAFDLETQQAQQSQANILDSLRGAAGGGGVAAMAQALAREGSIGAQQRAARIGQQERQNQMAERREAGRIQGLQIGGEMQKRADIKSRSETFLGMAQEKYAAKRQRAGEATQAYYDAVQGGIQNAADQFAGFDAG